MTARRSRPFTALLLAMAVLIGAAVQAAATPAALLIADTIRAERSPDRVIAEGEVEVLHEGIRLRARRIIYDAATDTITVEGPMTLTEGADTVFLAETAELSAGLQQGLLIGARLVLSEQLQLAAAEIRREDARVTRLARAVVSGCRVCPERPVPAWQIRAREVIHDAERQRLYFRDAQLRLWDVPVLWLPRLRVPDPSARRASGFLVPELVSSTRIGTGIRAPYFQTLGPHADVTLAPLLTNAGTRTLEFRFRRAFAAGSLEATGALTRDNLHPGPRGYLFVDGAWRLARGFELDGRLEAVSDAAYLAEYGYWARDRLRSHVRLSRIEGRRLFEAQLIGLHTLRDGESNDTIPWLQLEVESRRRWFPALAGGQASLRLGADGYWRNASLDGVGRDGLRVSGDLDWRRDWTSRGGLVLAAIAGGRAEVVAIRDDSAFPDPVTRSSVTAGLDLRWPLLRVGEGGSRHLLTPVAQLVWTSGAGGKLPNEDSQLVSFDDSNLFALDRFAGRDRQERGLRLNLGAQYTLLADGGWSIDATAGRVVRLRDSGQFTAESGLGGQLSHYVASIDFGSPGPVAAFGRLVFDDGLGVATAEAVLRYETHRLGIAGGYQWLRQDPQEGMTADISGIALDASVALGRGWGARASLRHDLVSGQPIRTGFGLEYRTDCIVVDLSLSRRYTASTNVMPATSLGLTISLAGLGDGRPMPRQGLGCG